MGTLNDLMAKAYRIKDDTYGDKPGYIKPDDIHPHMRAWIVSLALTIWAVFVVDGLFQACLVVSIWMVTQWSFFRARVKI